MKDTKGPALNERVWKLFEKAGFKTLPSSGSTAEFEVSIKDKQFPLDLCAVENELGVTIIGSNKAGSIKGWSKEVLYTQKLAKAAKADAALLVVTGIEVEEKDKRFALAHDVQVWGEAELQYFQAVADAIGEYARFELIHTLGVSTNEEQDVHKVVAIKIEQPISGSATELFLFSTTPERLLKTCSVYRRAGGNAEAYQRMLRKDRLPKIRRFVTRADALLPTNVVLALGDDVTVEPIKFSKKGLKSSAGQPIVLAKKGSFDLVALGIPMVYASLELLDGQHRLYGFCNTNPATKKGYNLAVLAIKGLTRQMKQDTFVAINDNSRRMDPNLVAFLKYTKDIATCQKDPELMAIHVTVELSQCTPFKSAIRLLDVGKQKITLKGFSGYDLRGLLGLRGALRKRYPKNDPADYVQVLSLYFSTIKSMFPTEWADDSTYLIATNRGVSAFLKLLRSLILTTKRKLTKKTIERYYAPLKNQNWDYKSLSKSYVGSQGWRDFYLDLAKVIQKKHKKFIV
jgi:DGQHR domain-containing protein